MPAEWAADHLWSRTDLKPEDVRVANLYDGFSMLPIIWMEALRLCGRGEGGPFVEGGSRIAIDTGVFALNPHGGQLSAGRLHGYGHIHEAVVQLRGEGMARQVPDDPAGGRGQQRSRAHGRVSPADQRSPLSTTG